MPLPLRSLTLIVALAALAAAAPAGQAPAPVQTDLDALMARVVARRDDNWKKLQQYVLEERERFALLGPDARPVYGFLRDYSWFIRQGHFVRSPLRVNGVAIGEAERKRAEAQWLADEARRTSKRARGGTAGDAAAPVAIPAPAAVDDVVRAGNEPRFVQAAYFLRFKFEPGRYGLVGRETVDGVPALRIEYYPRQLFHEGRTRPNRQLRDRDPHVEDKVNKASLVTLWVDPARQQILKYTFDNVDWDFLPGRSFVRIDSLVASMRMTEAFPSVWLPRSIQGRFKVVLAVGELEAQYDVDYHDYKRADVTYKVK